MNTNFYRCTAEFMQFTIGIHDPYMPPANCMVFVVEQWKFQRFPVMYIESETTITRAILYLAHITGRKLFFRTLSDPQLF